MNLNLGNMLGAERLRSKLKSDLEAGKRSSQQVSEIQSTSQVSQKTLGFIFSSIRWRTLRSERFKSQAANYHRLNQSHVTCMFVFMGSRDIFA